MSYASSGRQRSQVAQPKGQKRLTNVAIVKLKKGGCRFEVACYKNKVVNWRNKVETNLNEVLQSHDVFENVSKGKRATADDMRKVFGTDDVDEVAKMVIELGELQVSDGERAAANESLFQEIATIVAEKCVNPESNRPYPYTVIERVMKEIHYSLIPNRSAKQQALEVINKLQDHMPITRAKMKVQVTVPIKDSKSMKKYLDQHNAAVLEQKGGDILRLICMIDPGAYRGLDAFVNDPDIQDGSRSLEVIELSCHEEGEHSIDAEISKKTERLGMDDSATIVKPPTAPVAVAAPSGASKTGRPCSTCGGDFADMTLYREHFRSEWHRYNLKLKAKKRPVIDQAAFETLDARDVARFFETLD
ncbi:Aste57867_19969 [Aphanomyces stellatus]|uniref:Aste57867_19969 protein n=1 Tax=Aphanomyces stellatus TaxID=120398 RepID=A0A485LFE3_9STRA|nr:hypothetical protein As57867_019903 [Aphanomyces stellatus]VFT96666.1 Aste57867_19969 [Aphanomyces stellatus]